MMLARSDGLSMRASSQASRRSAVERVVRRMPIRWRILAIPALNSALALVLLFVVWNGAQSLGAAWADLRRVQQSERLLNSLGGDAERLQSLIHRYFAATDPAILEKIVDLRELLMSRLRVQARLDPLIAQPARDLTAITERFVAGFDDLREVRAGISLTYETKVSKPSREMADFYALLSTATPDRTSRVWPALVKLRESYNAMILATNSFYLSNAQLSGREAVSHSAAIVQAVPVLRQLVDDEARKSALDALAERADRVEEGIGDLSVWFATQTRLLRDSIDGTASEMSTAIDAARAGIQQLEASAQTRFDRTLDAAAVKLGIMAIAFVALVTLLGLGIARSVSEPLGELRRDMADVMAGDYGRGIAGLSARDEIGQMARAVSVFRENAIAKRVAEENLRRAKERAETALAEIRAMQTSLIEAEKLAALGGLVAGVAHEVNNPVGISLTVASTLANRSEAFAHEIASGQIRRSSLEAYAATTRVAAEQLVANLQRAAELVQSFKQVAVDRSQADERRSFDLREAVDQILASLRPSLRHAKIRLAVDIPDGIEMESFPGPLGQILTNLVLNAAHHAFQDMSGGTITIAVRTLGTNEVELAFQDDGRGMSDEVQRRAFDPFFTTRRGTGGTGLGLHIVYNIVTQRLGGRITLMSAPGAGTTFLIVLPVVTRIEPARPLPLPLTEKRPEDRHAGS